MPLPVDDIVDDVRAALDEARAVVVSAPPGSGKTTRLPPALLSGGPVLLVQPRRVAARSVARRIAFERGASVGGEVGWQVRFDRKFSRETRLLVVTDGILLARLQDDPLLSDFRTLVLDEVHERSAQMDLGFALARQVREAREDFRLVVMSATLDTTLYAEALDGCPVVEVETPSHRVEIEYRDGQRPAEAIQEARTRDPSGHLLCFLPGMAEIDRTARDLPESVGRGRIHRLHGSLTAREQDDALAPSHEPKIILATNVAETSLTVDGVTTVVDSGLQKVMRQDLRIGLDRLSTERVSLASATQRAGRAGRTAPGRAVRLWGAEQRLRPDREPEIHRIDLAPILLEILAWSEDPRTFAWLEPPRIDAVEAALDLLEELGARDGTALTDVGHAMRRLPLSPRLARVLIEAGPSRRAAELCARLAEPPPRKRGVAATTASDALARTELRGDAPASARRAAAQIERIAKRALGAGATPRDSDDDLRRALLAGFGDRLARRRAPGSNRLVLRSGHGARLSEESGVRDGEWLVAIELRAGKRGEGAEARIDTASRVEQEWLPTGNTTIEHEIDRASGRVRAFRRRRLGSLLLEERKTDVDSNAALPLLLEAVRTREPSAEEGRLLNRAKVAGVELDLDALAEAALVGAVSVPSLDFERMLTHELRDTLGRLAPHALEVPSGNRHRLEYRDDGEVVLAVKLQELFGLAESPRVGAPARPVTLSLLAPNGRPVQTTRDLRSFWEQTYPQVRKEMRGRYAKHPWPEDPWSATATARTKRRRNT